MQDGTNGGMIEAEPFSGHVRLYGEQASSLDSGIEHHG
jgi:hypothetical protein